MEVEVVAMVISAPSLGHIVGSHLLVSLLLSGDR